MRAAERIGHRRGMRGGAGPSVVPPEPSTDSWEVRRSLPGVIASDNVPSQAHFDQRTFYENPTTRKTYFDSVVKLSGGGSVRNDILTGTVGAGQWDDYMFDWGRYISAGQQVRVQWRQRFSQSWVDQNGGRIGGYISEFKNFVLMHGNNSAYNYLGRCASCPANQFTIVERHPATDGGAPAVGYPTIFHACGQPANNYSPLNTYLSPGWTSGGTTLSWQNVRNLTNPAYYSAIGAPGHREDEPHPYYGDEWMTFMIWLRFGPYGFGADSVTGVSQYGYTNSTAYFYLGRENEPLQLVHRQEGMTFRGYPPNANGVAITSISGGIITTGTPHGRSSGNTVWVYDTLTSLDGNSYVVSDVGSSTQLTLGGAPVVSATHGSLYFTDPVAAGLEDNAQPDPSVGQGRFFLYPTDYEGQTISVPQDAYIWVDEMLASTRVIPAPNYEPPAYVRAMSPLQSMPLPTVQAGGYATAWAAFQANSLFSSWDTVRPRGLSPAAHLEDVYVAWSGAVQDAKSSKLYIHGGGHADSAWNGILEYDFRSTDGVNPNGYSIVPGSLSDASNVIETTGAYLDGRPTAIHSYDNMAFDANNNRLFRCQGSSYISAGSSDGAWTFDFGTQAWTERTNLTGTTSPSLRGLHDPRTNKFMLLYQWQYWVIDLDTLVWEVNGVGHGGDFAGGQGGNQTGAFDYTRGRGVICGTDGNYTVAWDRTDNSVTVSSFAAPSAVTVDGPLGVYDHLRDCFWWYPIDRSLGGQTSGADTLYHLDASTLQWSTHTLTGSLPDLPPVDNKGHYGRMIYLDGWDALGCAFAYDQPAYIIKLPTE